MNMFRFILLFCVPFALVNNVRATAIEQFLTIIEQRTFQTDALMTIATTSSQPLNYQGRLTMCGNKFKVNIFGIEAAYDGNTLYMYSEDTDELTLSSPTSSELTEVNPFFFACELVKVCNVTEHEGTVDANGAKGTIITLTPKDASSVGISRCVLRLDAQWLPLSIEIKEPKKTTSLTFRHPVYLTDIEGQAINYTINYPEVFINDLR